MTQTFDDLFQDRVFEVEQQIEDQGLEVSNEQMKKAVNKANSDHTQEIFKRYHEQKKKEKDLEMSSEDIQQICSNQQGLVLYLAKKIQAQNKAGHRSGVYQTLVEFEDLIQEGQVGLIKAIGNYDISHPSKATFNTHAYWYVRARLQRALELGSRIVRAPKSQRSAVSLFIEMFDHYDEDWHERLMPSEQPDQKEEKVGTRGYFYELLNKGLKDFTEQDRELFCRKYGLFGQK